MRNRREIVAERIGSVWVARCERCEYVKRSRDRAKAEDALRLHIADWHGWGYWYDD